MDMVELLHSGRKLFKNLEVAGETVFFLCAHFSFSQPGQLD